MLCFSLVLGFLENTEALLRNKCIIKKNNFTTSQTEALLTMIIKKEHTESISPSTPLFSTKYCRDIHELCFKEKKEMRKKIYQC